MKNVLMLALSLFALTAFAQQEAQEIERKGFIIGFSAGAGVVSISDSNQEVPFDEAHGGFSFPNLKFGWMVSDRLAIMANLPGMSYEYDDKDRSFDALIPSVQYWMKDRWWINGGFGLAMDSPAIYEKNDGEGWNFGCAVAASTGFELVQKKKFVLDLQTQLMLGRTFLKNDQYRDGVALSVGLGFNWY